MRSIVDSCCHLGKRKEKKREKTNYISGGKDKYYFKALKRETQSAKLIS